MSRDCAEHLQNLAHEIVGTYAAEGGINRIGETELPSRGRVEAIVERLLTIVFPGFHGGRISDRTCLETLVASQLDAVFVELGEIVEKTLAFCAREDLALSRPLPGSELEGPLHEAAAEAVMDYLGQLPAIRESIRNDVTAAYEGDPAAISRDEVILCYPGLLAVTVHRLAHPLYLLGVPFVPRIMSEWAHARTGTDIHPGAVIGEGFFIDHATGVVIGETTVIGDRVKVYQGVTLGALSFRRRSDGSVVKGGKRHPTIEDDVTIYANATILGGRTTVGRGAVIGGGCWVVQSVPAGAQILTRIHAAPEPE